MDKTYEKCLKGGKNVCKLKDRISKKYHHQVNEFGFDNKILEEEKMEKRIKSLKKKRKEKEKLDAHIILNSKSKNK